MRNIGLFTFLIFLLVQSNIAEAQNQQNNHIQPDLSISISTSVVESIELFTLSHIQAGKVQPGEGKIRIDPISNPNAGSMKATGNPNSTIRISYRDVKELRAVDGDGILRFYYQVSGSPQDDQRTSEYIDTESRDFTFNENGEFYFWIGGQAELSGNISGRFEGDFTFEIEYN